MDVASAPRRDNAATESFFAALMNEMYYRPHWPTRARARFAVTEYIEVFYNRLRLHPTLGYRTPFEHSPRIRQQPPPDQQPEELSKIVDTAHTYQDQMVTGRA
jgi:transposase InsO family protein